MNVSLTHQLEQFVTERVQSGRYRSAGEVVREGLRCIERRPQARFDLLAMFDYVADNGGEVRAERYLRRLAGAIHDLARHPLMGRARPELGEAIRSFPFEDYVILYLSLADGVDLDRAWSPQDDPPPAQ